MAVVAEFISVLRKIRDVIYPEINTLYQDSLILKNEIDVGKVEFDTDYAQFNVDYGIFNTKKAQVDEAVVIAQSSASSASHSATIATNKSNEIKAITAQSTTGAPGTIASASYNPTDGKFTFVIPQGSKGDKGDSFTVNSSGTTAQRALYDAQPEGWSFLDITTSTLYFKASNANGDWSTGVPFGKGDKGDVGETGVGIVSFTFVSTTDQSGLPAKSGATDTYRVTLTNANTFDYNIYNGLDFNPNNYVEKTTIVDEDLLGISDSQNSFGLKKISWANIVTKLKLLFNIDTNGNIGTRTQTFNGFGGTGLKNYIINGNFDIWQRGDGYFTNYSIGADRWMVYNDTVTMVSSNTSSNGIQKRIAHILNVTAGNTFLAQAIELPFAGFGNPFVIGKKFTVSVRYISTTKIRPKLVFRDGSIGFNPVNLDSSMTSPVYKGGNSVDEIVSWTFTVDGTAVSTNTCLVLSLQSESNASNIYMYQVQLEEGEVATPFEQRPIGLELSLCQRYYETGKGYAIATGNSGSILQRSLVSHKVAKRVSPTSTVTYLSGTATSPVAINTNTTYTLVGFASTAIGQEMSYIYTASAEL